MADQNIAIVDRLEGDIAVLEFIEPRFGFQLPVEVLPEDVHEGAAVEFDFKLRPEIEAERRQEIRQLQDELIEKPDEE